MSWEAFRLTSRSPKELLHTLGPHGVDHLIRQALDALWREHDSQTRTFENVRRRAQEVFDRNMKVWESIKKPSPQAFFENLLPYPADGFIRQAMVLCWMMMPRSGGRKLSDVRKIITEIYNRNIQAWEQDNDFFAHGRRRPASASRKRASAARTARSKPGKKTDTRRKK
jgi:hypothetical protein